MNLMLISLILLVSIRSVKPHFSAPIRVLEVTSRQKAYTPRRHVFGKRYNLWTSTDTDYDYPVLGADDEVVPDDYEEAIEVTPTKKVKTVKSFKELGFGGKIVRGTRNIILVTTTNFGLGVTFGLLTAGVRGFPNLMTRKEGLLGTPWKEEIPMRLSRYTGKCYRWAKIWGPVFAIWGFTDTAVSILRNGDNDEFNFMIASSAAAVWHNRQKSVQRKVGVAILYAILTYGYVKFNEYYVVGPEGWQEKYNQNEDPVNTEEM